MDVFFPNLPLRGDVVKPGTSLPSRDMSWNSPVTLEQRDVPAIKVAAERHSLSGVFGRNALKPRCTSRLGQILDLNEWR